MDFKSVVTHQLRREGEMGGGGFGGVKGDISLTNSCHVNSITTTVVLSGHFGTILNSLSTLEDVKHRQRIVCYTAFRNLCSSSEA